MVYTYARRIPLTAHLLFCFITYSIVWASDIVPLCEVPLFMSASNCVQGELSSNSGSELVNQDCPVVAPASCFCSTPSHSSSIISALYYQASVNCGGDTAASTATSAFQQYCSANGPNALGASATTTVHTSSTKNQAATVGSDGPTSTSTPQSTTTPPSTAPSAALSSTDYLATSTATSNPPSSTASASIGGKGLTEDQKIAIGVGVPSVVLAALGIWATIARRR